MRCQNVPPGPGVPSVPYTPRSPRPCSPGLGSGESNKAEDGVPHAFPFILTRKAKRGTGRKSESSLSFQRADSGQYSPWEHERSGLGRGAKKASPRLGGRIHTDSHHLISWPCRPAPLFIDFENVDIKRILPCSLSPHGLLYAATRSGMITARPRRLGKKIEGV